jgi:hypothetical protein
MDHCAGLGDDETKRSSSATTAAQPAKLMSSPTSFTRGGAGARRHAPAPANSAKVMAKRAARKIDRPDVRRAYVPA